MTAIHGFFHSWFLQAGWSYNIPFSLLNELSDFFVQGDDVDVGISIDWVLASLYSVFAPSSGLQALEPWSGISEIIGNASVRNPDIASYFFTPSLRQAIPFDVFHADFNASLAAYYNAIRQTAMSVLSDAKQFIAFAEQGVFSANLVTFPAYNLQYLYSGLATYLISQIWVSKKFFPVIAIDTNPQALATNGTQLAYPIDCAAYNDVDVCEGWWYSELYSSAFSVIDFDNLDANPVDTATLTRLFTNYTSGELLFDGAYKCQSNSARHNVASVAPTIQGWSASCLSQATVLSWAKQCPGGQTLNECEFTSNANQPGFGEKSDSGGYRVPVSYLGPMIDDPVFRAVRPKG